MKLPRWLSTVAALGGFGLVWAVAAWLVAKPFLPGPLETLERLVRLVFGGSLGLHWWTSARRVILALIAAFPPAVLLGLAAGLSPRVDAVTRPLLYLLHPVPKVVFLPLFFLFLGLGEEPKVAVVAFILFSQLAVSARDGARRLPEGLLGQMRALGARRRHLWVDVVGPGVLPELFSALRIAFGTAVAVLFFAESFASTSGLGWFIIDAWARVDYLSMNAAILALAALGVAFLLLVDAAEFLFCPWRR